MLKYISKAERTLDGWTFKLCLDTYQLNLKSELIKLTTPNSSKLGLLTKTFPTPQGYKFYFSHGKYFINTESGEIYLLTTRHRIMFK